MKVTVVGAGAVGASCAEYIALKNFSFRSCPYRHQGRFCRRKSYGSYADSFS